MNRVYLALISVLAATARLRLARGGKVGRGVVLGLGLLAPMVILPAAAALPARPRITGIAGATWQAHDLGRSRVFYRDFLGFAERTRGQDHAGGPAGAWIEINARQQLELRPEREATSDRLLRVELVTDDAEAMRLYLAARGHPVPAQLNVDGAGRRNFDVTDPEGRRLRLIEPAPLGRLENGEGRQQADPRVAGRIRHVGFMVGELAASLQFYRGLLGFEETWRGSADGKTLSWVNLRVPDGDEYLEFMLFDPANPPEAERRGVLNHVCLEVADVAAAAHTLQGRALPAGCKAVSAMKTGRNGKRQINAYDPDGTRMEIMEPGTFDGQVVPSATAPPPPAVRARGEFTVRVSESADPIMRVVGPAFAAAGVGWQVQAKVDATARVMEALAKGEVPAAFITRNVRAGDLALAADIVGAPVGLDAIVLAVPASNPVTSLSVAQVRAIWVGEMVNWREVGGPDLAITVIGRPKAYDRIQLFCDFIKLEARPVEGGLQYRDKGKETWGPTVVAAPATDGEAAVMLERLPGAITYFPVEILRRYGVAGRPVRGLALDGREATPARIANGTYFIHRTVNVATKGPPGAPAEAFIAFLLSREGQRLIQEAGFLPYTP